MATVSVGTPASAQYQALRGKLAALSRWHPERVEEIQATRAELLTLTLEHEVREALAVVDLSAAQRHRVASLVLGGAR